MAVWFFIVVASFVFIWIVTGAYDPLTGSVLALIGISASTALGGVVIDANKDAATDNVDDALKRERLKIEADLAALRTTIGELQQQRAAPSAGIDLAESNSASPSVRPMSRRGPSACSRSTIRRWRWRGRCSHPPPGASGRIS